MLGIDPKDCGLSRGDPNDCGPRSVKCSFFWPLWLGDRILPIERRSTMSPGPRLECWVLILSPKSGLGSGLGLVALGKDDRIAWCWTSSLARHVALPDHGVGLDGQSCSCLIVGWPVGLSSPTHGAWLESVDRCPQLTIGRVRRQAEKELVQAGSEFPSSSAQVVAPGHGTEVVVPQDIRTLAGSGVPDAQALPAGSSTTPILVEDKERAADSMPPPAARKEIVLPLRAPSAVPVAQPKGRKRKLAKSGDGESSQQGGSSLASELLGKFMSLIDGMISECGSETSRLAGELVELQGRWSENEAMLTAVKDSHSAKVSKLEVAIGELERDLGKTASSLLKEKKARKAKSSEVRRLQRQIEGDAGLASCGIQEATDALRSEFQARLAKIFASLGSLECIRSRDLALATIESGMAVFRSFQSEAPPTLEAAEARLSGCRGDMVAVDGDFDLILADLKSACFLPT
ncbi:hypothetical protein DY000_02022460 [Brassica cretica]|uniref:Uncharacterized protein n=1 Tax=Brassica cretica TaxID=69181 RepID=A0ABQ7EBL4_BRACR|nr:hypothetical protein DY000_02022460 [Brassica cretica]